jgi:hypothetical protein
MQSVRKANARMYDIDIHTHTHTHTHLTRCWWGMCAIEAAAVHQHLINVQHEEADGASPLHTKDTHPLSGVSHTLSLGREGERG